MIMKRITRAFLATSVAGAALVGIQLATAPTASARCLGASKAVTSDLFTPSGVRVAWETPKSGTCNNNGRYSGTLHARSGWMVAIYRQNGGTWHRVKFQPGDFTWSASTHKSQEVLCAQQVGVYDATSWCGLGHDVAAEANGTTGEDVQFYDLSLGTLSKGF